MNAGHGVTKRHDDDARPGCYHRPMANDPFRFFGYAGCSTCTKARKFLESNRVAFESIPIVDAPPTAAELRRFVAASGKSARAFVNVSGGSYRALIAERGKEAVAALSDDALLALLAADGKMIKRPLLVRGETVVVGFDEAAYARALG